MKLATNELQAVGDIKDAMMEPQPLPMGMAEFEAWSDRIIAGAMCQATPRSQKFMLANQIMHLPPTESFKCDAYFIHTLRKAAANEVAHAKIKEIKAQYEAEAAASTEGSPSEQ